MVSVSRHQSLRTAGRGRNGHTLRPSAARVPRRHDADAGSALYMAGPRPAEAKPVVHLDPKRLARSPRPASSIKGPPRSAVTVGGPGLEPVDLVVAGWVAVGEDGARLGKGGGFSDLELAVAAEAGLVAPTTVVVTTVHEMQVRPTGEIPTVDHDIHVDLVVTPDRVIECARPPGYERPRLHWEELTD